MCENNHFETRALTTRGLLVEAFLEESIIPLRYWKVPRKRGEEEVTEGKPVYRGSPNIDARRTLVDLTNRL